MEWSLLNPAYSKKVVASAHQATEDTCAVIVARDGQVFFQYQTDIIDGVSQVTTQKVKSFIELLVLIAKFNKQTKVVYL